MRGTVNAPDFDSANAFAGWNTYFKHAIEFGGFFGDEVCFRSQFFEMTGTIINGSFVGPLGRPVAWLEDGTPTGTTPVSAPLAARRPMRPRIPPRPIIPLTSSNPLPHGGG
jgi:hypothetical protein